MSDTSPIIGQADALMRKHRRTFVVGGASSADMPPTSVVDDVPVLTEVVDDFDAPLQNSGDTARLLDEHIAFVIEQRCELLEKELEAWVDAHLPQAIAAALDQFSDQLMARLSLHARTELLPQLLLALQTGEAVSTHSAHVSPQAKETPPV